MNKHPFDTYHHLGTDACASRAARPRTAPPPLQGPRCRVFLCSIIDSLLPLMGYAAAAVLLLLLRSCRPHAVLKPLDDPVAFRLGRCCCAEAQAKVNEAGKK